MSVDGSLVCVCVCVCARVCVCQAAPQMRQIGGMYVRTRVLGQDLL